MKKETEKERKYERHDFLGFSLNNSERYAKYLDIVAYNRYQNKHFIPNEMFNDILELKLKPSHTAFIYSYYYLISWLYRHAKYGELPINNSFIKEILGYSANNKPINYIMKEGGLLDSKGYTLSTKNYPVKIHGSYSDNAPKFTLVEDLSQGGRGKLFKRINRNFKAKYPIKHMHKYTDDLEEGMLTGVYYDPSNTHQINFEVFAFCMSNWDIGTTGFYIYSYLKSKCQQFKGGYQVSYLYLSEQLGIPYSTLAKYLDILRGYNMVIGIQNQEYYVEGMGQEDREANDYIVNESVSEFYFTKKDYSKIQGIDIEKYRVLKERKEKF